MAQVPPAPLPISDIYIDESSQTAHRYLVLGGIIAKKEIVDDFAEAVDRARVPELPRGEMKWGKASRSKLPAYQRVIDLFFQPQLRGVHFHSLVVDTSRQNHARYNQGSRDIGFNKEIYQLAIKFGRLYPRELFHLYLDKRTTTQLPDELRLILNRGIRANHGDTRDWPYRRTQFRDSKDCKILQLVDILIGAVAWTLNGHHLAADASPAKTALATYILGRAGIGNAARDTGMRGKFTIWHRRLR